MFEKFIVYWIYVLFIKMNSYANKKIKNFCEETDRVRNQYKGC